MIHKKMTELSSDSHFGRENTSVVDQGIISGIILSTLDVFLIIVLQKCISAKKFLCYSSSNKF